MSNTRDGDFSLENNTGSGLRAELNKVLADISTMNSGPLTSLASQPRTPGYFFLDTTNNIIYICDNAATPAYEQLFNLNTREWLASGSGEDNVQVDWSETNTSSDSFIKSKPTTITTDQSDAIVANTTKVGFTAPLARDAVAISDDGSTLTYTDASDAVQTFTPSGGGEDNVQADWSETTTSDDSFIKNKPTTITGAQTSAIVANTSKRSYPSDDETKLSNIAANAEVNVQADWSETTTDDDSFIKNKPTTITTDQADAIAANTSKVGFTALLAQDALDISDNNSILTYKDKSGITQTFKPSPQEFQTATRSGFGITFTDNSEGSGFNNFVLEFDSNSDMPYSVQTGTEIEFFKGFSAETGWQHVGNSRNFICNPRTATIADFTDDISSAWNNGDLITQNNPSEDVRSDINQYSSQLKDGDNITVQFYKTDNSATILPTLTDDEWTGNTVAAFSQLITVAGQVFIKGSIVYYLNEAYMYLGSSTLTTTESSPLPSAGGDWDLLTGTGGGGSGEDNVQADWSETTTSDDAFIKNKPTTITTDQSDAIAANTSKRTYPSGDETKLATIATNAEVNVQADWSETTTGDDSFIKNKPTTITTDQSDAIAANTSKISFTEVAARDALAISDDGTTLTYTDASDSIQTFNPSGNGRLKNYATLTAFTAGDIIQSGDTQWRAIADISNTNTIAPVEGTGKWSQIMTASQVADDLNVTGTTLQLRSGTTVLDSVTIPATYNDADARDALAVSVSGNTLTFTDASDNVQQWSPSGTGTGEENVQADWSVTSTSNDAFIKNKPAIPSQYTNNLARDAVAVSASGNTLTFTDSSDNVQQWSPSGTGEGEENVQADWSVTSTSNDAFIKNKPTTISGSQTNKLSGIETGAEVNVQADWSTTNSASDSFVKNKPSFGGLPAYATLTAYPIGSIVTNNNTQWKALTVIAVTNTTAPAENDTWSELATVDRTELSTFQNTLTYKGANAAITTWEPLGTYTDIRARTALSVSATTDTLTFTDAAGSVNTWTPTGGGSGTYTDAKARDAVNVSEVNDTLSYVDSSDVTQAWNPLGKVSDKFKLYLDADFDSGQGTGRGWIDWEQTLQTDTSAGYWPTGDLPSGISLPAGLDYSSDGNQFTLSTTTENSYNMLIGFRGSISSDGNIGHPFFSVFVSVGEFLTVIQAVPFTITSSAPVSYGITGPTNFKLLDVFFEGPSDNYTTYSLADSGKSYTQGSTTSAEGGKGIGSGATATEALQVIAGNYIYSNGGGSLVSITDGVLPGTSTVAKVALIDSHSNVYKVHSFSTTQGTGSDTDSGVFNENLTVDSGGDRYVIRTSDFTATVNATNYVNGAAAVTVSIPTPSEEGARLNIVDISGNASVHNITLDPESSVSIDGSTSNKIINRNNGYLELISTGTTAWITAAAPNDFGITPAQSTKLSSIPNIPAIADDTSKKFELQVVDTLGAEVATWVEASSSSGSGVSDDGIIEKLILSMKYNAGSPIYQAENTFELELSGSNSYTNGSPDAGSTFLPTTVDSSSLPTGWAYTAATNSVSARLTNNTGKTVYLVSDERINNGKLLGLTPASLSATVSFTAVTSGAPDIIFRPSGHGGSNDTEITPVVGDVAVNSTPLTRQNDGVVQDGEYIAIGISGGSFTGTLNKVVLTLKTGTAEATFNAVLDSSNTIFTGAAIGSFEEDNPSLSRMLEIIGSGIASKFSTVSVGIVGDKPISDLVAEATGQQGSVRFTSGNIPSTLAPEGRWDLRDSAATVSNASVSYTSWSDWVGEFFYREYIDNISDDVGNYIYDTIDLNGVGGRDLTGEGFLIKFVDSTNSDIYALFELSANALDSDEVHPVLVLGSLLKESGTPPASFTTGNGWIISLFLKEKYLEIDTNQYKAVTSPSVTLGGSAASGYAPSYPSIPVYVGIDPGLYNTARDALAISDDNGVLTYTDAGDVVQTYTPQTDWNETDSATGSYITNKPADIKNWVVVGGPRLALQAISTNSTLSSATIKYDSGDSSRDFYYAAAENNQAPTFALIMELNVGDSAGISTTGDFGTGYTVHVNCGDANLSLEDKIDIWVAQINGNSNFLITASKLGTDTIVFADLNPAYGVILLEKITNVSVSGFVLNGNISYSNGPDTVGIGQVFKLGSIVTYYGNSYMYFGSGLTTTGSSPLPSVGEDWAPITPLPIEVKTSSFVAVSNMTYVVEPESVVTVTLPSSPSLGDRIVIADSAGLSDLFNIDVISLNNTSGFLISGSFYYNPNYRISNAYEVLEIYFDGIYWTRNSNFPKNDRPDEVSITLPDTFNAGDRDTPLLTLDIVENFGFAALFGGAPRGWPSLTPTNTLPTGWDYAVSTFEGDNVSGVLTNNTGATVSISEISVTLDNFLGFQDTDYLQITAYPSGNGNFVNNGIFTLINVYPAGTSYDLTGPVTFKLEALSTAPTSYFNGYIDIPDGETISITVSLAHQAETASKTMQVTNFELRTPAQMPSFLSADYTKTGITYAAGQFISSFLDGSSATEVLTDLGNNIRKYNGHLIKVGALTSTTLADGTTSAKTLKLKMPRATTASEFPLTSNLEVNRGTGTTGTTLTSLRGILDTDDSVAQEFQRSLQATGQEVFTVTLTPTTSISNFDNFIITDDGDNLFRVYGPHPNASWTDKDDNVDGTAPAVGAPRYRAAVVGIATPTTGTDAEKRASIAADLATILPAFFATVGGGSLAISVTSSENSISLVADSFGTIALTDNTGNWAGKVAFTQPVDAVSLMPTPNQIFGVGQMVAFLGEAYMYLGSSALTTVAASVLPSAGGGWKKLT